MRRRARRRRCPSRPATRTRTAGGGCAPGACARCGSGSPRRCRRR
uniref:Trehalose-6-phosphate synthase n=1 Tax=Arundo donax TaxID=35708 RepID=A0A0A9D9H8_ARUDO